MENKFSILILFTLIASSLFSMTLIQTTASAEYVQINFKEFKTSSASNFTFKDWQNALVDSVSRGSISYDPYHNIFNTYQIVNMGLKLNDSSIRSGIIRTFLPLILESFRVTQNGSISYLSSDNNEYIVLLPKIIDLFYQSRQLVQDLDEYTPISFNEALEYGINTFFVRDIDGTVYIDYFVEMDNLEFILEDRLYLLEMHPYCTRIQTLIADYVYNRLNFLNYETNWTETAKTAIAAIKASIELNNSTLTSKGYEKLNQLFEKTYYVSDNDTGGIKLQIAEYLLNYNVSYAQDIVNYVISLLFHTPYGLEPIVATERAIHEKFFCPKLVIKEQEV